MEIKKNDRLKVICILFCITLYFFYGAMTGTTYIPFKNATAEVKGFLAWWLFSSFSLFFLYISCLFRGPKRIRVKLEKFKIDTLIFLIVLTVLPIIAAGFQASKSGV
jgi:hypothetical protein